MMENALAYAPRLQLRYFKHLTYQPPSPNRTSLFARYPDLSVPDSGVTPIIGDSASNGATVGGSVRDAVLKATN